MKVEMKAQSPFDQQHANALQGLSGIPVVVKPQDNKLPIHASQLMLLPPVHMTVSCHLVKLNSMLVLRQPLRWNADAYPAGRCGIDSK